MWAIAVWSRTALRADIQTKQNNLRGLPRTAELIRTIRTELGITDINTMTRI
jgi:hypothetical protein